MSLVLNVEILGEFKKLTEATKGSQKSLGSLEGSAKSISKGINTALGAIGIGFSLNFLIDQFKESTKAAIEDAKSKALLTQALKTNLNVTDRQIDSVEKYISKLQITTSITDDKLRPAYQKLALSAGDTTKAMDLLAIATDVAAGTGKDLDTVAQAMAKALEGNDTALSRLVPSVRGAKDPIAELAATFDGAAEAAANTDPYARMQIIFGEMQEQIGTALLPILEDFSEWLSTPEGQEKLQEIVDGIVTMVQEFTNFVDYIANEVQPGLEELTGEKGIGAVVEAIGNLIILLGTLRIAMLFMTAGNPFVAGVVAGIALIAGAYKLLGSEIDEVIDKQNEFRSASGAPSGIPLGTGSPISAAGGKIGIIGRPAVPTVTPKPTTGTQVPLGNTSITVNVNGSKLTAPEIVKEIQKYQVQTGARFIQ